MTEPKTSTVAEPLESSIFVLIQSELKKQISVNDYYFLKNNTLHPIDSVVSNDPYWSVYNELYKELCGVW